MPKASIQKAIERAANVMVTFLSKSAKKQHEIKTRATQKDVQKTTAQIDELKKHIDSL